MARTDLDLNEQIEEVRELLYDIVKKSETGVDSVLLAQEYDRQFVQTGIARALPAAWLRYVKAADEFEVKQENGQTIISIVQQTLMPTIKDLNITTELPAVEEKILPPLENVDLKPLPLSSMPKCKTKVHVITVTDPDNISIRLSSWDPMPDYLYCALSKDFSNETKSVNRVLPVEGMIYVAKLPNGSWERVKLVRASKLMGDKGFYVVYAIDVGIYHLVHKKNLQAVSNSLQAFKNYLLAKCKLANIKPANNQRLWSREAQQALNEWLSDAQDTEIEMIPVDDWTLLEDNPSAVPFVNAELVINGEDIGVKMIGLGLAEQVNFGCPTFLNHSFLTSSSKRLEFLLGSLSVGATSILAYKQAHCLTMSDPDKQMVPRRLQRFLSFASVEYQGCVYMTPQDLLDSLTLDQPRERVFRNVLRKEQIEKYFQTTPVLRKSDKTLFRRLAHDGIISYSEYLFLLTLLTKSKSSFQIAFSIFDDDGNQRIDKHEFLKIQAVINCGLNLVAELGGNDFEQLSTSKGKSLDDMPEDEVTTVVTLPENIKELETTILVHLFGVNGKNSLTFDQFQLFYKNLQDELVDIEFHEFARGNDMISVVDFARLIFRYTTLKYDDQIVYINRVSHQMDRDEKGITKEQFEQFSCFLNNLEDFTRAVKLYVNANIPVSRSEFIRAVKCSTNLVLDAHLVDVLFMIFDKNNDGQLTYSELLAIMNDRANRGFKNQTSKMSSTGWRVFKKCLLREVSLT